MIRGEDPFHKPPSQKPLQLRASWITLIISVLGSLFIMYLGVYLFNFVSQMEKIIIPGFGNDIPPELIPPEMRYAIEDRPLIPPDSIILFYLIALGFIMAGLLLFLFVVNRQSASISISNKGILFSRIFGRRENERSWLEIISINIVWENWRRSKGNVRVEIRTKTEENQIKLSNISLLEVKNFALVIEQISNQNANHKSERRGFALFSPRCTHSWLWTFNNMLIANS